MVSHVLFLSRVTIKYQFYGAEKGFTGHTHQNIDKLSSKAKWSESPKHHFN